MSEHASAAGWLVEVVIGGQQETWHAAIPDPSAAVDAVRTACQALPLENVEAKFPLSDDEITQLNLRPGEVRRHAGDTNP